MSVFDQSNQTVGKQYNEGMSFEDQKKAVELLQSTLFFTKSFVLLMETYLKQQKLEPGSMEAKAAASLSEEGERAQQLTSEIASFILHLKGRDEV